MLTSILRVDIADRATHVTLYSSNSEELKRITLFAWNPDLYKKDTNLAVWDYFHVGDNSAYAISSRALQAMVVNSGGATPSGISMVGLVFHELVHTVISDDHSEWGAKFGYQLNPNQTPNEAFNEFLKKNDCIK